MALDWSLKDVKDNHELFIEVEGNQQLHPKTHALIWACVGVEMNGIRETNYEEFAARLELLQDVIGGAVADSETGANIRLTVHDVKRHIGLHTNVATKPWTRFLAKLRVRAENRVRDQIATEMEVKS